MHIGLIKKFLKEIFPSVCHVQPIYTFSKKSPLCCVLTLVSEMSVRSLDFSESLSKLGTPLVEVALDVIRVSSC